MFSVTARRASASSGVCSTTGDSVTHTLMPSGLYAVHAEVVKEGARKLTSAMWRGGVVDHDDRTLDDGAITAMLRHSLAGHVGQAILVRAVVACRDGIVVSERDVQEWERMREEAWASWPDRSSIPTS